MGWGWGEEWQYRAAVLFEIPAAGVISIDFDVPKEWDFFWNNVLSSGYDVRFAGPDGLTELGHERVSWNSTTRLASFKVAGFDFTNVQTLGFDVGVLWLYWGNDTIVADPSTVQGAIQASGFVLLDRPRGNSAIEWQPPQAGATAPDISLAKSTAETRAFWWNASPLLGRSQSEVNGRRFSEEPFALKNRVYQAGVAQPAMVVLADGTLGAAFFNGRYALRSGVTAGTDANDYTHSVELATTSPDVETGEILNIYDLRALLSVNDVSET